MAISEPVQGIPRSAVSADMSDAWRSGFGALIDAATEGFLLFDEKLNLLWANNAAVDMLNLSPSSTDKCISDVLPGAAQNQAYSRYAEVIVTGETFVDEVAWNSLSGEVIIGIKAVRVDNGLGIITNDVTASRRVNTELPYADSYYRTIIEHAIDAIMVVDINGIIRYENAVIERIVGYSAAEREGESVFDLIHPDDIPQAVRDFEKLVSKRTNHVCTEFRLRHKDNSWRWVTATVTDLVDDPVVRGLVAGFRDITEHKQAELALSESEQQFRTMFNGAACGFVLVSTSGDVLRINPAYQDILGYTLEDLQKMDLLGVMHEDDALLDLELFKEMMTGKRNHYQLEKRFVRKDGGLVWGRLTLSACGGPGEEPQFIIAMIDDISERRMAEQALENSERYFRSLIENMHDVFVIVKENGNIQYESPLVERMLGYKADDYLGRDAFKFLHADDKLKAMNDFLHTLQNPGEAYFTELRARHKDGSWHILEITAKNLLDDPAVGGIVANFRDITVRKKAEDALQDREKYFRALLDNSSDYIVVLDADATVRYISPSLEQFQGDESVSRIGSNALRVYKMEDEAEMINDWFELLSNPGSSVQRVVNIWPEGEPRRTYEVVGRNLLADPVVAGIVVNFHDITERRQAEDDLAEYRQHLEELVEERTADLQNANEQLRCEIVERKQAEEIVCRQEAYFRSLIENLQEVIVVLNADGAIRYVSPSSENVSGYSTDERIGNSILDMIDPDDIQRSVEQLTYLLQTPNASVDMIVRIKHKDGFNRVIEATGKNLLHDRAVSGIVINCRDITDQKKAEEELQLLYSKEKQLRRQIEKEMVRRVEFTRMLVHELKTPLTPMVISSQVLASELKGEPLRSVARNISHGASNLNSRIDELIDMTKGEIGILQLNKRKMDMLLLLREVAEYIAPITKTRSQWLQLDLPDLLPWIQADSGRLRQVILNLLNNAIKYTPEGGRIYLQAEATDTDLIIEVRDTGPGIAEEDQKHLFTPYKHERGKGDRLSGLGLGLALCRTLVELHGGEIWVRSQNSEGSVFGFSLPLGDHTGSPSQRLQ